RRSCGSCCPLWLLCSFGKWPGRKSAPRLGAKARYTRGPLHTCRRQRAVEVTEGTPVEALPALARRTLSADDGAVELALPQVVRRRCGIGQQRQQEGENDQAHGQASRIGMASL